ncbi:hypothetical protein [Rhodocyclus tenuis]|uniref:hypothetical protein n=1 Tax=Rhodocyclus tenuis TaxID=1066 RepID=UPI0019057DAC|nr:hypothetical protein [Rhodocyclus tenuis]
MIVLVKLMRYQGRRLSWKEIGESRGYKGSLLMVSPQHSDRPIAAKLNGYGGKGEPLLPDLHDPVLTGFGIDLFHLRGIERIELPGGRHAVIQEWRCWPVRDLLPPTPE